MSQRFALNADHAREILIDAADTQVIAGVTWQTADGWVMFKSRLLGRRGEHELLVEFPESEDNAAGLPDVGQEISVSFRRGSRKCVFDAPVIGTLELERNGQTLSTIRVAWPEQLIDLQRRLYQRTPVPRGRFIPVDLWMKQAGAQDEDETDASAHRGRMLDLSGGGVSIELPRELRPRWRENDQLALRFVTDPDRQPVEIPARLTHYSRESDGHVRLGLQFLGLDACEQGRHTLRRIQQMTSRLRRFRRNDRD